MVTRKSRRRGVSRPVLTALELHDVRELATGGRAEDLVGALFPRERLGNPFQPGPDLRPSELVASEAAEQSGILAVRETVAEGTASPLDQLVIGPVRLGQCFSQAVLWRSRVHYGSPVRGRPPPGRAVLL
jgi:hypothetical protein